MSQPVSFFDRLNQWARNSVTLKLFIIAMLILLLLIPASMLRSLIYERENVRDAAIQEVSAKWGQEQTLSGPVISVPYQSTQLDNQGKAIVTTGYAHFLPDTVNVTGKLNPEKRYRGIYVVVLYETALKISGSFSPLNAAALTVPEADLRWEDALFTLGISDMKGIRNAMKVQLNGVTHEFGPGTVTNDILPAGTSVPIDLREAYQQDLRFTLDLDLNGSSDLYFTPFGKETLVRLEGNWPNPSFEGAFLPDERTVDNNGFQASWRVLQLNRNYPQQGQGPYISNHPSDIIDYSVGADQGGFRGQTNAFGVRLLLPIDEYQKTMRSAKYAGFFIFITFLAFFFIEVLNRKRLHPIQYILVGAAIMLFYVLLLSISEHLNFNMAYLISCVVILTLITGYCSYALRNRKLTLLVGGMLAILYGFFFSLLQLQDYALLLGSLGLLLILGAIMYLTRNIDWYSLRNEE
ncbi:MAG: cell envelope integrity protein CreD [Lewinellaceae bacterium]|nr:cell envelope integrity protein CreD [Lewinellaceae bacterium]